MAPSLAPVRKQVRVLLPPAEAFELFTSGIDRWWPFATHSCFQADAAHIAFEPRAGGRVVEHSRDGRQADWGRIVEWQPPERFSMTWHPANDPSQATHLQVDFAHTPEGGTLVTLVHSGWEVRGKDAASIRGNYDAGWDLTLARYVAAAG